MALPYGDAAPAVTADVVAATAAATLGRPVGPDDNLFEAGFTSKALVQLHALLGSSLGVQVPVAAMFSAPTVRALADRLSERAAARPVLVPADASSARPRPPGAGTLSNAGLSRRDAREALRRRRDRTSVHTA